MSEAVTVTEVLLGGAQHGDRPCFGLVHAADSSLRSTLSFGSAVEDGLRYGALLRAAGVERGSRVVFVARPCTEWIAAFAGTLFAGGVAAPVNDNYRRRELAAIVASCEPAVVVVDASTRDVVRDALAASGSGARVLELGVDVPEGEILDEPEPVLPSDLAVILHTSGTTGVPKGVERSHGEYASFVQRWGARAMCREDRVMNFLPLYHQAGLVCAFLCAYATGVPVYHVDRFDRNTFWQTVDRLQLTWAVLMQPVPRYLLESPPDPGDREHALRWVIATMSPEDWVAFQERFGVALHSSYGSTEATIVRMTGGREDPPVDPARVHGPLGGALAGGRLDDRGDARVVDDEGRPLGPDQPGLIEVRGESVFARYFRDAAASAAAFNREGWFDTGDRGYISAAGDLYLLERLSAVIRRSGENIAPREVEEVIELHPAISEAAVVGVADETRGQEIAAFVVLRPGVRLDATELFDFCGQHLAYFKIPRHLEVREELPKTPTFKVRRDALRLSDAGIDRQRLKREASTRDRS